jgi:hypothetical protein
VKNELKTENCFSEESFMSSGDALKRRKTVSVFSFQLPVKNELKTENCFSEESFMPHSGALKQ